jgi:hypothetical protein
MEAAMSRDHHRPARAVIATSVLTLAGVAAIGAPVTSQSPSVPPMSEPGASTGPGASGAAVPSAVAIDVAAIEWKQSQKSKGFDAGREQSPMAFDLAVGPDGRFLLAGALNDLGGRPAKAVVWGSDDGVRWTALKGSVPKGSQAAAVVAMEEGFLIAGDVDRSGPLLRSSDGMRLTKLDAPAETLPTGALYALERTPLGLVAAGEDADHAPTIWTSTDGAAWTGVPIPDATYIIHVAATDTGTVVALGIQQDENGNRLPMTWSSPDGVTWTPAPFPVEAGNWSVPDLERTPLGVIAALVGGQERTGSAWLSRDGVTWTQVLETPDVPLVGSAGTEAIVFGVDRWWHSADGATWTEAAAPFDGYRIETSAVRPDGAVVAAGYLYGGMEGSSVRTWIGAPPAS